MAYIAELLNKIIDKLEGVYAFLTFLFVILFVFLYNIFKLAIKK